MADMDNDFRKFLESSKATRELLMQYDNAKNEDEKSKILSKAQGEFGDKYLNWSKLPMELKERYQNIGVPQWILDVASSRTYAELLILVEHPEINSREQFEQQVRIEEQKAREAYEKMREEFVASAAAVAVVAAPIVAAGYSQKAANDLANERLFRDELFKELGERKPTFFELGIILNSQRKTWEIIHKEWREHLPERHLMHLLSQYNRGNIDAEKLIPQLADTIQRIHTEGHLEHFDKYLQHPLVRAKLRHFKPEKMDELLNVIGQQLYGGNRHPENQIDAKEKVNLLNRDLPEDVKTVLQKVADAQKDARLRMPHERLRVRLNKVNTQ